ncbi:hypothetical protein BURK2_00689 [Burkholderiales bacterium]|nr:hypothetical protein BURK2_00689 [Burkholderiales bacterium]
MVEQRFDGGQLSFGLGQFTGGSTHPLDELARGRFLDGEARHFFVAPLSQELGGDAPELVTIGGIDFLLGIGVSLRQALRDRLAALFETCLPRRRGERGQRHQPPGERQEESAGEPMGGRAS